MTRKRLNKDDLSLWKKVAERTEKLDVDKLFRAEIDGAAALKGPAPTPPQIRKTTSVLLGKPNPKPRRNTHDLVPSLPEQMRQSPVQMDSKAFGKLKRGKMRPEGRIDLHGMTLDRAHPALTKFILGSHAKGRRLVLVITGKGKMRDEGGPIPVRHGVLRHQVPQWLSMPPLSSAVLQVSQAHISHGGGGAYYVYLRRHR
ncbi:MAG: Smr/MutS family protein [Sulfitobacter litoralis]|jgi:DNA-nicking Smr family endonuclease|uniref:DNA mismatch repair protein MutS n=2 Tax=root TaxID=1 RepID=A0A1H0NNK2_9RHOB|nr:MULTISPECIES: Smr/MutS family protein [Sulfitobacter]MBQ0716102.1 Smr/MutS family protein [Sulfitobacter litoralis]MBQ0766302.1 Smr/MutS family protein [Sulfitobacter litoralis]MBQ0801072.1 Smr/MutS family protein [Sulfitobacter litoralis]MCF7727413.1 DNA mismatch repair protein MutS [Sulfitobacter sp. M22]MCF7778775.1 DNA mismatch repair protein MutS [Sulfitobacter sp. M220]|tara:strand:+ start:263 stop:862 length:600 start_codon:yes stop_codon:yes gene_type:complete